jgi:hypothetical protein
MRVALQPVSDALGPPLAGLWQAASLLGLQAWQAVAGMWLGLGSLLCALLAPFAQLVLDVWASLASTLAPLAMVSEHYPTSSCGLREAFCPQG